jgi:hypothetical protein
MLCIGHTLSILQNVLGRRVVTTFVTRMYAAKVVLLLLSLTNFLQILLDMALVVSFLIPVARFCSLWIYGGDIRILIHNHATM